MVYLSRTPGTGKSAVRGCGRWSRRSGEKNLVEWQDIDDELPATGAKSAAHVNLVYIGKDGTLRVIPGGFFGAGHQVVISSSTTSPKAMALSARPDVAPSIDTPDQARPLSTRGRAMVEIVDGVVEQYGAAGRKTTDAQAAAEFAQHVRGIYDQMALIAIIGCWVRYCDFGAGRMSRSCRNWPSSNSPDGRATLGTPHGSADTAGLDASHIARRCDARHRHILGGGQMECRGWAGH